MVFKDSDFKATFTKGSGPGGQHRNKVETAATVTHIPTGMVQKCQASRSKQTNYETALSILKSKLIAIENEAKHNALNGIRKASIFDTTNGSNVVRTYNFKRGQVKSHKTGKTADLDKVLNGHIELIQDFPTE